MIKVCPHGRVATTVSTTGGAMTKARHHQGSIFFTLGILVPAVALALAFLAAQSASAQAVKNGKAKETTLYTFTDGTDGGNPYGGVVRDAAGNLYGTTFYGGNANMGVVFKVSKSGKQTVLYSFPGKPDAAHPGSDLLLGKDGNLYGASYYGGTFGFGAIFRVTKSGKEKVLYSFGALPDGEYPGSGLAQDDAGNLYGTTGYGGDSDNGTVFKVSKSGKEKILHSFAGPDGQNPFSTLLRDAAGTLYGTTSLGGTSGNGTVFKITKGGKETVLHSFAGGTDGANPYAGLVQDDKGNFYGTTYYGGAGCQGYDCGTVFRMTPKGKTTVLHAFGLTDGHYPDFGTLVRDTAGNLYGTTYAGGTADMGIIFKVASKGKESILYSFTGGSDEGFPVAGLIQDATGTLYGVTLGNGNTPVTYGTVFKLKP